MVKLILNIFNNKYVKAIIVLDITILLTMLFITFLYTFPIIYSFISFNNTSIFMFNRIF